MIFSDKNVHNNNEIRYAFWNGGSNSEVSDMLEKKILSEMEQLIFWHLDLNQNNIYTCPAIDYSQSL